MNNSNGHDITGNSGKPLKIPGDSMGSQTLAELQRLRTGLMAYFSQDFSDEAAIHRPPTQESQHTDTRGIIKKRSRSFESFEPGTGRIKYLINGTQDVTLFERSVLYLEQRPSQISNVIKDISPELEIITRQHRLQISISNRLPAVFIDPKWIGLVILSLVHNAAKFSREGSLIIIEAKNHHGEVMIGVTDQGIGIPPHVQEKIFNRICTANNICEQDNSYFGLSMCRGIIKAQGGRIQARSRIGYGSCFKFTLPVSRKG